MEDQDFVCYAMFVAFFDPVEGNKLEWSITNSNKSQEEKGLLDNVEMTVLAPGFEKIDEDHVIFQHHSMSNVFGCAAFHKLTTTDPKERFSRMRSVGVMSNNVSHMHKSIPLLNWLACRVNNNPGDWSLLEKASDVLFSCSQTTNIVSDIDAFFKVNEEISPQCLKSTTLSTLSIDYASYLVIWRAVLSQCRVLLFSKSQAGCLCDMAVLLLKSGCKNSQPLMFRTYDVNESLFDDSNSSWFAATTDMRLVLGMGRPSPCWDILIDFDNGNSGAHFKQDNNIIHSVLVRNSNFAPKTISSFTIHMTGKCDQRVRQSICKNNLQMWKVVNNPHPLTASSANSENSDTDYRHQYLASWWEKVESETKAIANMESTHPEMKVKKNNAIKVFLRKFAVESSHIPWLLYICAKFGIDVSGISAVAIMKLKLGLLIGKLTKSTASKKIVPINS